MKTKKNENKFVINSDEELDKFLKENKGDYYFSNAVLKDEEKEVVDRSTGETSKIHENGVIHEKGDSVKDVYSQLLFEFQSGVISKIEISDQKRSGVEYLGSSSDLWMAKVKCEGKRKMKLLAMVGGFENAYNAFKDYIELRLDGMFEIQMMKKMDDFYIIEDDVVSAQEDEDGDLQDKQYYVVFASVDYGNTIIDQKYLLKASNVDNAKLVISNYNSKLEEESRREDGKIMEVKRITIMSANVMPINQIIEKEFCKAYSKDGYEE